jgi:hypothetical protein
MSGISKTISKMRTNPNGWQIETLLHIAERYGIEIRSTGGSHFIFSHVAISFNLSIPARKPIKPFYIKQFISLVDVAKEHQRHEPETDQSH